MFDWSVLAFLWILLASFVAGFGWYVGNWVAKRLLG